MHFYAAVTFFFLFFFFFAFTFWEKSLCPPLFGAELRHCPVTLLQYTAIFNAQVWSYIIVYILL